MSVPRLVAVRAVSLRELELGFDEDIQVSPASAFKLESLSSPAVPLNVIEAFAEGSVAKLRVDVEMSPDALYEVIVAGVMDLAGNPVQGPFRRSTFRGFRPTRPDKRRFDLWKMLPKHNRRADHTGDLRRFIACLQEVTDLLLADIDRFPDIFDIDRAPTPFLDLILIDLGDPFRFDLDELGKRRLASVLVEMYRQKGTARGIINAVWFFLGIQILDITSYAGEGLVLGESELGVDWILGPSGRFALYAFDVVVGEVLTDEQRRLLRAVVEYLKPAHTHLGAALSGRRDSHVRTRC